MATASTRALVPPNPTMSQHTGVRHTDQVYPLTQGYATGFVASGTHPEYLGYGVPIPPLHQARGANTSLPLRVHKHRPEHRSSGNHNQFMSPSLYDENASRVSSGLEPRQNALPASLTQSPRYAPSQTAMNGPTMNISSGVMQTAYVHSNMMPGGVVSQAYSPNVVQPGILPPYAMQNLSVAHGYYRNASDPQMLQYPIPISDMTNMHHTASAIPHSFDGRRRRSIHQYTNANNLFDPYEGNNPAFRNMGYTNGKKHGQSGPQNPSGRQRKVSFPGNRSAYGQQATEQSGSFRVAPGYGSQPGGPISQYEPNRAITEDQQYGCSEDWIGPLNETVNELFLKDLPIDIQESEIEATFFDRIGVKPTFVRFLGNNISFPNRRSAFIG